MRLVAILAVAASLIPVVAAQTRPSELTYPVVDTGQAWCFGNTGQLRKAPRVGEAFFGQDACYRGNQPSYRDNADGTVSDLVTGLMWQKACGDKVTFGEAKEKAKSLRLAGHEDWRLPTIKELYSLIDFRGCVSTDKPIPYIDTKFFDFRWGDTTKGERIIDAQFWSATEYLGTTMNDNATVFGVNFADGRIKGYPRDRGRGGPMKEFVRFVRGNPQYGQNRFVDNKDGTISDLATGLMWSKADDGKAINWQEALAWCENLKLAGHDDWRLPNAKELQSIVDYTRAPEAREAGRRGPAIDPVFQMTDPAGWFWSGTTHLDGPELGARAVYVAFGKATGFMAFPPDGGGPKKLMDVHGAGAQRSDPKAGDPARYPQGMGPQGDTIRVLNFARAVRNIQEKAVRIVEPDTTAVPYRPMTGPPPGEKPGQRGSGPEGRPF